MRPNNNDFYVIQIFWFNNLVQLHLCITSSVAAVSPTSQPSAEPGLIADDATPIHVISAVIESIVIAVCLVTITAGIIVVYLQA